MPLPLPIDAILPRVATTLTQDRACIITAPPGSGKTTRTPLALLNAPWLEKRKIIMLEPRRLAARAAARHMAGLLGEKCGQTIGYRTRLDSRVSRQTRVEVLTEGILTRMLQTDPELGDYACILFDEFHERSLHADLGLSLCLDVQKSIRPDLRLIVMSATLDANMLVDLLGSGRIFSCPGQPHAVETRYLRVSGSTVEERMAQAIALALSTEQGGVLAFLPGAREIERTAELLGALGPDVNLHPLLGSRTLAQQDAAIAPAPPGQRKVVLATAIAETSLTIDGVRIIVDSGLARLPRFDARSGMTRLVTENAALATLAQRQGRAGRTESGLCLRIWEQRDEINRKPFPTPEILEADLTALALELARWGTPDPARLSWVTPPPVGHYQQATRLLHELGATDAQGRITTHGQALALLPLHPRLGHMVLLAREHGLGSTAVALAALLAEPNRSLRGASDLRQSLAGLRTRTSRQETVDVAREQIARLASVTPGTLNAESAGILIALAYPDRIARRQPDGSYRLTSGRKAFWPGPNALAEQEFLAIAELDGEATGARIWQAAPLSRTELETFFGSKTTWKTDVSFDSAKDRVLAVRRRLLGEVCLEEESWTPEPSLITATLLKAVDVTRLPWSRECQDFRDRIRFLRSLDATRWPDLSDQVLQDTLLGWLEPFATNARSVASLAPVLLDAMKALIGWQSLPLMDALAPQSLIVPSGIQRRIDYGPASGPILAIKLQEMFGCQDTPTLVAGTYPLTIHLLSPAKRPLQITRDLATFWKNVYPQVRAEMRGRYPKHPWPEDPITATPTARTTRRR